MKTESQTGIRSGVFAGGNWIVDKVKFIDRYPQQDALANIASESLSNGGSPFNVLIDLARMGARFPLFGAGLVGPDEDGKWILAQCAAHHIDIRQLRIHPEASTSYTDVMVVRSSGRRTFFHQRGANAFLDDQHFDFASNSAKIFHLGYLLLLDQLDQPDPQFGTVAARVLQRASAAGCLTSIDLVSEDSQRFESVVLPALPHVDYCILNEFELERTTAIQTRQDGDINLAAVQNAAACLLKAGVRKWVIVHFLEGACALNPAGQFHVQPSLLIPQTEIKSTVGAGDSFAAGVLYGMHEELPIQTSLQYGICAAAACLRGFGTSDGILPLADCLQLEKKYGVRPLGSLTGMTS